MINSIEACYGVQRPEVLQELLRKIEEVKGMADPSLREPVAPPAEANNLAEAEDATPTPL